MAGAVGWFMVLRRQTFAGHTLSVIAFPGAAAATLAGLPLAVGYFGACGLGRAGAGRGRPAGRTAGAGESAAIGTVQAFALGLGFLFVSLYSGHLASLESLLFGTFLGITQGQVQTLLCVAVAALAGARRDRPAAALRLGRRRGRPRRRRPDPAARRRLPAAARAGGRGDRQITGALLVFALLVTPGGDRAAAHRAAGPRLRALGRARPARHLVGLTIAYFSPYPVGFWVTTLAFGLYVVVRLAWPLPRRGAGPPRRRTPRRAAEAGAPDVRPRVHAQRLPRRHLRRARLRPGRLLRRPPRPGLRRRRAQPRRLHRRAAAAAAGIDIRLGLFVATIAVAAGIGGARPPRPRPTTSSSARSSPGSSGSACSSSRSSSAGSSGADGTAAVRVLFGSILGLSAGDAWLAAAIAIARLPGARWRSPGRCCSASLDPEVARGLGVPVRALGIAFLVVLGVVAAEATQAVGALLLLGLLAAPGGAARLLTDRPWHGLALSAAIAVGSTWAGLGAELRDRIAAGGHGDRRRRHRRLPASPRARVERPRRAGPSTC